jgi:hypothetical protein
MFSCLFCIRGVYIKCSVISDRLHDTIRPKMYVWFEIKENVKTVVWNVTPSSLVQATEINISKKVTASIFRAEGSCIVKWRQQVPSKRWYLTTKRDVAEYSNLNIYRTKSLRSLTKVNISQPWKCFSYA